MLAETEKVHGLTANPMLVTRRIEEVSGIRPVTLLIAFGIVLIIVILMVTGIAANHLRVQALITAEDDLARVDTVLAEATSRSITAVDARLAGIANRIQPNQYNSVPFPDAAAAPETGALLRRALDLYPAATAGAVIDDAGAVLNRAGEWPNGDAIGHGLVADLRTWPARPVILGAAIPGRHLDDATVPLAHRITDGSGQTIGAVVALVPLSDLTALFATVPLSPDAAIALLRPDGSVLAQYPEEPGARAPLDAAAGAHLDAMVGNLTETIVRHFAGDRGQWQIEAIHPLVGYPAAVVVRRGADRVMAEWANQGLWFGAFALVLAIAIGIMVYLISRQFQTHAALAQMREERIEAEKVESERARLAAEAELLKKERLSVLGQLTATVAHELRNPLSAIRNTLFTVKELSAGSGIKLDRPLGRIERSIERCDRIIADLLEYTRHRELKRSTVRFDRWLADLLAEQSTTMQIALKPELAAGDEAVAIDPDRLRRVVINLVDNAAQALAETPPEHQKCITVRSGIEGGELVLAVEDTGPGIKPENLERIFEPLFSTKTFGTGLGLPTVRQIVNQHDGKIAVASEIGRGTTVTIRLPLPAAAANAAIAAGAPAAAEAVRVAA